MVEHNLEVVANLSHTITVLARGRDPGRGRLRRGLEEPGRGRGVHGVGPCLRRRAAAGTGPEVAAAVEDLQAWYGESHILHGVDFRFAPASW